MKGEREEIGERRDRDVNSSKIYIQVLQLNNFKSVKVI